jgi:hypothetical protein
MARRLLDEMVVLIRRSSGLAVVERKRTKPGGDGERVRVRLRILRIALNRQETAQRAFEIGCLPRAEWNDREADALRWRRGVMKAEFVVTG